LLLFADVVEDGQLTLETGDVVLERRHVT